jgi:hypothetical protein
VSGVEGGGADGGSVSGARRRPLRNGCRGGPATAAPARGSGARQPLGAVVSGARSGAVEAKQCSGRWWRRPANAQVVEGGGSAPGTAAVVVLVLGPQ